MNEYKIIPLDQPDDLMTLCRHAQDMKVRPLKPTDLLRHVIAKLKTNHCVAYGCKRDGELIGGVVATSIQPTIGDVMLWVDFLWSSQNDLTLGLELLDQVEIFAKEKGFTRTGMGVKRGFGAIEKAAGYTENYRVYEKEVI